MVATAFFPVQSSSPAASCKFSESNGGGPESGHRWVVGEAQSSYQRAADEGGCLSCSKVNGTKVGYKTGGDKVVEDVPSYAPSTFYNQLPDWSMLLAAITTVFFAVEKQWTLMDWKLKQPHMLADILVDELLWSGENCAEWTYVQAEIFNSII